MRFKFIDLFCGAGGTTSGIHRAIRNGVPVAEVVACVNHDKEAIASHAANYPDCLHFTEDIRTLDVSLLPTRKPGDTSIWILWASLECTHFSRAKNGAKNADSRTLAEHLYRYIDHLQPDYVMIENVSEFRSWGPLCDNGRPLKRKNGTSFLKWKEEICSRGYRYADRDMNSADYGAYTSRTRYFGLFAKGDLPIIYPEPTHDKKERYGLPKWRAVRDVLDFTDEGLSIFSPERRTPLVERTLKRIYAGLEKHVRKNGKGEWLVKYLSNNAETGVNDGASVDEPCPVISTQNRLYLANATFLSKYNNTPGGGVNPGTSADEPAGTLTGACHQAVVNASFAFDYRDKNGKLHELDKPAGTLTTKEHLGKVDASFLLQYKNNQTLRDTDEPDPTLTTKEHLAKIQASFIMDNQYETMPKSTDEPLGTILTSTKQNLVQPAFLLNGNYDNPPENLDKPAPTLTASRRHHYIVNPMYQGATREVCDPCFTLVASMDKTPPYLMVTEEGKIQIEVLDTDSEYTRRIKEFMNEFGIIDIRMRMLNIPELKRIQGFGDGYILVGSQSQQKKFIGNAVVPHVPKAWLEALWDEIYNDRNGVKRPLKKVTESLEGMLFAY